MPLSKRNFSSDTFLTSFKLPLKLHQQLVQKSEEMGGIGISKTIQILLKSVLEHPNSQHQINHMILIYSLIQESILSLVEDGADLIDRAEKKAESLIEQLSQNSLDK